MEGTRSMLRLKCKKTMGRAKMDVSLGRMARMLWMYADVMHVDNKMSLEPVSVSLNLLLQR